MCCEFAEERSKNLKYIYEKYLVGSQDFLRSLTFSGYCLYNSNVLDLKKIKTSLKLNALCMLGLESFDFIFVLLSIKVLIRVRMYPILKIS